MMLYASASATPQSVLFLMRLPFKGGFTFFVVFNSLMEWLFLPAALFLNWHIPARRKLLITGAILYYGARCWSYIYFVPAIFRLMAVHADTPLSADLVSQITRWVNLSWIRCAVDGVLACLLLFATSKPYASSYATKPRKQTLPNFQV
jgi:uncharacterized membrane protein